MPDLSSPSMAWWISPLSQSNCCASGQVPKAHSPAVRQSMTVPLVASSWALNSWGDKSLLDEKNMGVKLTRVPPIQQTALGCTTLRHGEKVPQALVSQRGHWMHLDRCGVVRHTGRIGAPARWRSLVGMGRGRNSGSHRVHGRTGLFWRCRAVPRAHGPGRLNALVFEQRIDGRRQSVVLVSHHISRVVSS